MSTASSGAPHASVRVRVLATLLFAICLAGVGALGVFGFYVHTSLNNTLLIPFCGFAVVGWLIAIRRPRNPVGWLFLSIGVLTGMSGWTAPLVDLALERHWPLHGIVLFAGWFQMWFWYPLFFSATAYTVLLFPDGLPSRRWRFVLIPMSVALFVMTLMPALSPTIDFGEHPVRHVANPIGIRGTHGDPENSLLFGAAAVLMLGGMVASLLSLVLRFRRSRGVERAQLKWFILGASALVVHLVISLSWRGYDRSFVGGAVFLIALTCLPVSCGLAILRYRLYDIDRIVSRTVSYAVVTGLIVAMYVGVVALVDGVLGSSSSVAVAASTLAAAAAFQPLRRRVQRTVDRRFDREAYDARRTVERFSTSLRDQVDVDGVRDDLLTTVAFAVSPTSASVWLVRT